MEHYLLKILNDTTEYIEDHLCNEMTLDSISENVNMSKFHLLRIWKGATGTGLMEYVRRRRIASTLSDLLSHINTINFIADKYGFGSERTFNRAFKDEFGITPAKWRKTPAPLNILDRFNADFMNQAGSGLIFLKSVTVLPAFSIAGITHELDFEDNMYNQTANRLGVEFFHQHRTKVLNPVEKDIYVGYTSVMNDGLKYAYYQPSIQVDGSSIIPPGMAKKQIPAHKYGVFTYMGLHRPEEISSRNLKELLDFINIKWMPTVEFCLKESFWLQYINYARCSKQYCECDLYFPIGCL
ncbi:AraC family transcriptional regulator [Pseudobacteroides cellulosolvens]|uniref:Transcriptional regulator with only HTH domain, AraC family n=1 Tax=Pseudobacteroides cellulosolvens ATCC 35603 = DSM 2933 TaxID=398512 RepID=A0A0L6JIY4_9FIRM|nr:helix-turn-helix domain-containing protein [Pseudobacteroides cellulosolvens]KNY25658.1 transcriptional regulator with only HTH domain, AraC family [Pseudobacteroides cellulosolvens ATCC 35603 = DSM 2933]